MAVSRKFGLLYKRQGWAIITLELLKICYRDLYLGGQLYSVGGSDTDMKSIGANPG